MRQRFQGLLAALGLLAMGLPAAAQTELSVDYAFGSRTKVYQAIADAFMAKHPETRIVFRVPSANYEEGHEAIVRQALVNQLPDVHFESLNQFPDLVERKLAVDLAPFVGDRASAEQQGYIPALLDLVTQDGRLYGLPFLTGSPIVIANGELVRRAGGDCAHLPKTWDDYAALAEKIHALDPSLMGGMVATNDDWQFQALVDSAGGHILTSDGKDIAFDGPEGQRAMAALDRFAKASGMVTMSYTSASQPFAAGRVGLWINAAEYLNLLQTQVAKGFEFCTGTFPAVDPQHARGTPIGGAAAVILTTDPAKQKAAFDFISFATGAEGQALLVAGKGYPPVNKRAYDIASVQEFFRANPLRQPDIAQVEHGLPWVVFPGQNSVKIVRVIRDNVNRILQQSATPEQALTDMAREARALLPPK